MEAGGRHTWVEARGLRHHLLEWPGEALPVLLLHGFLEHAHTWDRLAPRLAAAGHRVLALDLRGHGESDWVGAGGYYHFADYGGDVAMVVRRLGIERVAVIGHSMGGNVAMQVAAAERARVASLVLLEGAGPGFADPASAPERFANWIGELERMEGRSARPVTSIEEAADRIAERWPQLGRENALHVARHNAREEGGVLFWRYDPLHQTTGPTPYIRAHAEALWRGIEAPVLFVEGAKSPIRTFATNLDERLAALRAHHVVLDGVGHHPHLEAAVETARVILDFLAPLRAAA